MFFCGLRYCLGRRTHIVYICTDAISKNWSGFSTRLKSAIRHEIRSAILENRAGDIDIDVPKWLDILHLPVDVDYCYACGSAINEYKDDNILLPTCRCSQQEP